VLCTAQDKDAVRLTLEQIDLIRRVCTENPELELVTTAEGTTTLKLTNSLDHLSNILIEMLTVILTFIDWYVI